MVLRVAACTLVYRLADDNSVNFNCVTTVSVLQRRKATSVHTPKSPSHLKAFYTRVLIEPTTTPLSQRPTVTLEKRSKRRTLGHFTPNFGLFQWIRRPFLVFWRAIGRNYHFLKILGYVHRTCKVSYPDLNAFF